MLSYLQKCLEQQRKHAKELAALRRREASAVFGRSWEYKDKLSYIGFVKDPKTGLYEVFKEGRPYSYTMGQDEYDLLVEFFGPWKDFHYPNLPSWELWYDSLDEGTRAKIIRKEYPDLDCF